ncbi:hypothetical protein SS50377_20039 [Spironucleus salmonicida]|uniref:Uncharacterized protein n=1 Tax=Spironucleus salmonicida TaxID=348837 RepID=V6LXN2_9EUKA|nr:hypothetical protein SS50377_20039 [Spironucleus salmonicida]|eukprot:EST49392.1 Hypothetical protein SS50377_10317 [Spironucleus salmonicida]
MKVKAVKTSNSKILLKNVPKFHHTSQDKNQIQSTTFDYKTYETADQGSIYHQLQLLLQSKSPKHTLQQKPKKVKPIKLVADNTEVLLQSQLKKSRNIQKSNLQIGTKQSLNFDCHIPKQKSTKSSQKLSSSKPKKQHMKIQNSKNSSINSNSSINTNDANQLNDKISDVKKLQKQLQQGQFSKKGQVLLDILNDDVRYIQDIVRLKLQNHISIISNGEDTTQVNISNVENEQDSVISTIISNQHDSQSIQAEEAQIPYKSLGFSQETIEIQIKSLVKSIILEALNEISLSDSQKLDNRREIIEQVTQKVILDQFPLQQFQEQQEKDEYLILSSRSNKSHEVEAIDIKLADTQGSFQIETNHVQIPIYNIFKKEYQVNSSAKLDYAKLQQLQEGKYSPTNEIRVSQAVQESKQDDESSGTIVVTISTIEMNISQPNMSTLEKPLGNSVTDTQINSVMQEIEKQGVKEVSSSQNSMTINKQNEEESQSEYNSFVTEDDQQIVNSVLEEEDQATKSHSLDSLKDESNTDQVLKNMKQQQVDSVLDGINATNSDTVKHSHVLSLLSQQEEVLLKESTKTEVSDDTNFNKEIYSEQTKEQNQDQQLQEDKSQFEEYNDSDDNQIIDSIPQQLLDAFSQGLNSINDILERNDKDLFSNFEVNTIIDQKLEKLDHDQLMDEIKSKVITSPDYIFDDAEIDNELNLMTSSGPMINLQQIEMSNSVTSQTSQNKSNLSLSENDQEILQKVIDINEINLDINFNKDDDSLIFFVPDRIFTQEKIHKIVPQFLNYIHNPKESQFSYVYFTDKQFLIDIVISQAQDLGLIIQQNDLQINSVAQLKDTIDYGNENQISWNQDYAPFQQMLITNIISFSAKRQWLYTAMESPLKNIEKSVTVGQKVQFGVLEQVSEALIEDLIKETIQSFLIDL